jgi:hypothetical protein
MGKKADSLQARVFQVAKDMKCKVCLTSCLFLAVDGCGGSTRGGGDEAGSYHPDSGMADGFDAASSGGASTSSDGTSAGEGGSASPDAANLAEGSAGRWDGGGSGGFPPWPLPPANPEDIPPGPQLCGGLECAPNEVCCLVDLTCVDSSQPGACSGDAPPGYGDPSTSHCSSNADCDATEFCRLYNIMSVCGGTGSCISRSFCGGCLSDTCEVCGCDGKNYPDMQTACLAGTNILEGACGTEISLSDDGSPPRTLTRCGTDADCSSGELCCGFTGSCFDPFAVYRPTAHASHASPTTNATHRSSASAPVAKGRAGVRRPTPTCSSAVACSSQYVDVTGTRTRMKAARMRAESASPRKDHVRSCLPRHERRLA